MRLSKKQREAIKMIYSKEMVDKLYNEGKILRSWNTMRQLVYGKNPINTEESIYSIKVLIKHCERTAKAQGLDISGLFK